MEDHTPQSQANHDKPAHHQGGVKANRSIDADVRHLDAEVRATDAFVGEVLRAENAALLESSASPMIEQIFAASLPYLKSSKDQQSSGNLRLVDGNPTLHADATRERRPSNIVLLRNQDHRLPWRSVAAIAAVLLIVLTLSIIYSPSNQLKLTPPGDEFASTLVDSGVLDTEMAALWDDLDDLEEEVFVAAYHVPLAESASYWAMTELDDAIGDLEADLGAF